LYAIAPEILLPRKLFSVDPSPASRVRFFVDLSFVKSKTAGPNCNRPARGCHPLDGKKIRPAP
jgi:hypothetical protein